MLKCGIDIGGTNIKFGFFDGEKKVNSVVIKTPKVKEKVIPSIVCEIKKKYKPSDILGYTVAIPGVVLNDVVVFAPNTDIFGLNFKEELGLLLENDNIIVENDINHTNVNSKELFDLARAKDKLAIKCINDCARYLAITIATVVATTGIKEVHIAGGLSNAGEAFLRNVRYHYPKYCVRNMEDVKIKQAYLQYEAGTYAAKYLIGDEKNA